MKTVLAWVLGAYLFISAGLFLAQRTLLFHPPADPGLPSAYGLEEAQVVDITSEVGLKLKSWYIAPQNGKPVLVHLPGNASSLANRAPMAAQLATLGYGQLIVGYRGYSGNPGSPTEAGLYADARANLKWLGAQPFVLMGESLGTGVAVQMATEFQPKAVILESPYASIAATAQYHYWWLPAYWLVRDRFDSLSKISHVHVPLLVVQGDSDPVVPTKFGRMVFAAANEPKQALWLEDIGHMPWRSPLTYPAISKWLAELK